MSETVEVPVEPTHEMIARGWQAAHRVETRDRCNHEMLREAFAAMLAARPATERETRQEIYDAIGQETCALLQKIMTVFVHPEIYAAQREEYELVYDRGEWEAEILIEEYVAKRTASLRSQLAEKDKRIAGLKEGLRPFSTVASTVADRYPDWDHDGWLVVCVGGIELTMEPFRRAGALLNDPE